jgi:hypothetical protein
VIAKDDVLSVGAMLPPPFQRPMGSISIDCLQISGAMPEIPTGRCRCYEMMTNDD